MKAKITHSNFLSKAMANLYIVTLLNLNLKISIKLEIFTGEIPFLKLLL